MNLSTGHKITMKNFDSFVSNILNCGYNPNSIDVLSKTFQVHKGTARRWLENKKIPLAYKNTDQFYTSKSMAELCFEIFKKETKKLKIDLKDYYFLEPSGGTGSFYNLFPKERRLGMDLFPKCKGIKKRDYLSWKPKNKRKYVILGNPPFGLRGNMALKFINHSEPFVDVIGFILPQLFESDGKGSPMKRIKGYNLIYSKKLKDNTFYNENNRAVSVNVIFQVWTKLKTNLSLKKKNCDTFIKVYSLSNGGTPASTRNKKMLDKCDIYLPSTCFNGMKAYDSFKNLPNNRGYGVVILEKKREIIKILKNYDWKKQSFKSTNSALNLRTSLIKEALIKKGFYDVCS